METKLITPTRTKVRTSYGELASRFELVFFFFQINKHYFGVAPLFAFRDFLPIVGLGFEGVFWGNKWREIDRKKSIRDHVQREG